jgi:hypothetical protein
VAAYSAYGSPSGLLVGSLAQYSSSQEVIPTGLNAVPFLFGMPGSDTGSEQVEQLLQAREVVADAGFGQ